MLKHLIVDNIALIEHGELSLDPGLTVISGETGAGKTALLSALKLLIGERADTGAIRDGATRCTVEGVFEAQGKTFTVRRTVTTDSRSHCWIDGKQVPVKELAARVGPLVDLHGQHEHQRLLSRESHGEYLDQWIGTEALDARQRYEEAFTARRQAQQELDNILQAARASARDSEARAFALSEIEAVNPSLEEYEELTAEMPTLLNAESLATGAATAHELLSRDQGALDLLAEAQNALSHNLGVDAEGDDLADRIESCAAELSDVAGELRQWRDRLDFDPEVLEGKMQRLATLEGLCKKYGPRMVDVLATRDEARRLAEVTDTSAEAIEKATAALDAAEEQLMFAAAALKAVREEHVDEFSAALTTALDELGMEQAALMTVCTDLPRQAWSANGPTQVEFHYTPARAVSPRPLNRIASGGELSRVMLALKSQMRFLEDDATLVFDEIDAGIGGATGMLVADKLSQISQGHQTLVVTHLPTIAAKADRQFSVRKTDDALPKTLIQPVEGQERIAEIARMLSGDADDAAVAHAMGLLGGEGRA